jgi:hypothetical protein
MGDLRGFAKSIRLRGEAVVANTDEVVRRVALLIDTAVVMATPVKTGRARANWRAGVGAAPAEEVPAPSSPGGGVQEALDQARSVVASYQGGSEIHITNNLPYIGRLNAGHSSQAPAGFVELAVVRAAAALKNAKGICGDLEMEES